MLKSCKHSNCAICKATEERKVFESILKTLNPDLFVCKDAMYKITNYEGKEFVINSLEYLSKGNKEYFIQDPYTLKTIYLNKDNFEVVCTKDGECAVTPFTQEYIPGQKNKAAD